MRVNSAYRIIREVKIIEVLRHFISMEADRDKYKDMRDKMLGWLRLSNRKFIRKVHRFEKDRDDVNPALGWTIGANGNKHYQNVSRWVLANIQLTDLYTCDIKSKMKDDLDSVNGNLEQFVKAGYAREYTDFQQDRVPSEGKARIVIGIARRESGRNGSIELIDGAHRIVAMLVNGITECDAYIGEIG